MDRRWGVLVLLLALVAVVATPALAGSPLTGQPTSAPVPGPPSPGDCLTDPLPARDYTFPAKVADYPAQDLEACTGRRYGEVMRVVQRPAEIRSPSVESSETTTDPNLNSCYADLDRYLGTDLPDAQPWSQDLQIALVMVGPTARQRAAHQGWAACVAVVLDLVGGVDGMVTPSRPFSGALRAGLADGSLADLVGTCFAAPLSVSGNPTPCDQPHATELFAWAGGPTPYQTLVAGCQALVGMLTRQPGFRTVTASAPSDVAVDVKVWREPGFEDVGQQSEAPDRYFTCAVTAVDKHKLTGSLIGLGDRPLPLR